MVQGPSYSCHYNQAETWADLDQGGRGAGEDKWSNFKLILTNIMGLADGFGMG